MKRLLTVLLISGAFVMASGQANAQSMGSDYQTALGLKFFPGAISIKHFVDDRDALEGLGYFWDHGFRFTGLYEIHAPIAGAPGLKWYIGPGAHVGVYSDAWYNDGHVYNSGAVSFGLDGVLGLDYKINQAPIDVSLDFQPSLEILNHPYFSGWGGLGVRYTF
jgi:hypothetical protein